MQQLTEEEISREVTRIEAGRNERARRNAEERAQTRARMIQSTIRWFKERIEDDDHSWLLHICHECIEGCVAGQLGRFCAEGRAMILANLRDRD
jgi:hypothetical protein